MISHTNVFVSHFQVFLQRFADKPSAVKSEFDSSLKQRTMDMEKDHREGQCISSYSGVICRISQKKVSRFDSVQRNRSLNFTLKDLKPILLLWYCVLTAHVRIKLAYEPLPQNGTSLLRSAKRNA